MKKLSKLFVVLHLIVSFGAICSYAQNKNLYIAWAKVKGLDMIYVGGIQSLTDNSLNVNEVFLRADGKADYQSIDIRYRNIYSIKVRRSNSVRKRTIIGTLTGLTLSAINVVALYSDPVGH